MRPKMPEMKVPGMRLQAALVISFPLLAGPLAADSPPVPRAEIERLLDSDIHDWRFKLGDVPGAHAPGFDDSEWALVDLGHKWWPHESTC